jgi:hypothetical protein
MARYEEYIEDSTVQEVHRIREELSRQQKESGLSYFDWLKATENDLRKSLAEVGFRMITRNGRVFLHEIQPSLKNSSGKFKTASKPNGKRFISPSPVPKYKKAKYKNYDDYLEDSTMREIHRIQEEMEQQFKKSGFSSYFEWLQATDKDLQKSLAEDGFQIVTRNGRTYLDEIKPRARKNKVQHKTSMKRRKTASRGKSKR